MDWLELWRFLGNAGSVVGVAAAVIAFFLWKDWTREMRLQDRIEALERDQKEVLLPLVKECSTIIAQNTAVMLRLEKMLKRQNVAEAQSERSMLDQLLEDAQKAREDQ